MLVIRHRVNTVEELRKTPKKYGVEVDIRGYGNKLILTHEPVAERGKYDELEEYLQHFDHAFIIFNIKEAGYEQKIIDLAEKYGMKNYFLLDVEFPYLYRATRKESIKKIAVRYSEAEPIELALAQTENGTSLVDWVWVDTNTKLPLNAENYSHLKQAGFKICLVCPERWGRPEDIIVYKDYMKKNNIKIDAVMTSLSCANLWEMEN